MHIKDSIHLNPPTSSSAPKKQNLGTTEHKEPPHVSLYINAYFLKFIYPFY